MEREIDNPFMADSLALVLILKVVQICKKSDVMLK